MSPVASDAAPFRIFGVSAGTSDLDVVRYTYQRERGTTVKISPERMEQILANAREQKAEKQKAERVAAFALIAKAGK
jgi:preprotein translocase subunit Sec63